MSEESDYNAVNIFRQIKSQTGCDDTAAAILTLAQCIPNSLTVYPENGEEYGLDRVGKDIADAIEAVTHEGSIRLSLDGEMINNVQGIMDVNTDIGEKPKPKPSKKNKK
jgi:hypothetical protein